MILSVCVQVAECLEGDEGTDRDFQVVVIDAPFVPQPGDIITLVGKVVGRQIDLDGEIVVTVEVPIGQVGVRADRLRSSCLAVCSERA